MPFAAGTLTMVVNTFDQPETQDPLGLRARRSCSNPRQADPAHSCSTRAKARARTRSGSCNINLGSRGQNPGEDVSRRPADHAIQAIPLAAQVAGNAVGRRRRSGFRLRRHRPAVDAQRERRANDRSISPQGPTTTAWPSTARVSQQIRHSRALSNVTKKTRSPTATPLRTARVEARAALERKLPGCAIAG